MKHSKMKKAMGLKGFLNSMSKPKMKSGGFPDLNKDGQITKADILMGRGVIGKKKAQAGMKTAPKYTAADSARYEETGKRFDKLSRDYMRSPWQITNSPQGDYKLYPGAREDILKKADSMTSNPYFINKIKPEYERQKNAKPKGQKGMKIMKEAKKNATRTITDGYKGTGAPNPLAAIVKNTATKKATIEGLGETVIPTKKKPKMQMGGAFFPQNPLTASKYQKDTLMGQSFKKGGMIKKKKK